jgi:hypothetical protein
MLQPPLPLHSFFPAQSFEAVLQPPFPLHSFFPAQQAFLLDPSGVAEEATLAATAADPSGFGAEDAWEQPATSPETAVIARARASCFMLGD